jgi:hypothetical protein
VGKSAIVQRAAQRAAGRFPDGQVWIDLRGNRSRVQRVGTGEALARALRALGVPAADIALTTDERAARYRPALSELRVLVLLDNAVDAAHVRPFVPAGSGSAVLVTSRRSLATLDTATHLEVGPMPDASALELLGALAGADRVAAEPDGADQLVRRCAGLPLALRIAGARLASRPQWTLAQFAGKLAGGPALLDELTYEDLSVRACFHAGYQPLAAAEPEAARVFRLLGVLPAGEVVPYTVARRVGAGIERVTRILERLVDARLLECVRTGQYRLPGLLHHYAAELAGELGASTATPGTRSHELTHATGSTGRWKIRSDFTRPATTTGTSVSSQATRVRS